MARPEGSVGRKTLQAIGILAEKGCDPLGILADIAMGTVFYKQDGEAMEPSLDQRKDCAKELCQYIYPKRKAVEHTGLDGGEIVITRIERQIVDPADTHS